MNTVSNMASLDEDTVSLGGQKTSSTPTRLAIRTTYQTPSRSSTVLHPTITTSPYDYQDGCCESSLAKSPTENEGGQWSSAVGGATLGKSGRVIERLMADIDRLKRELRAEQFHRQEIERRERTNFGMLDNTRAENANLVQAKDVDAALIKRRDRKIEELKTELETERSRRIHAEESASQAARQRDEADTENRRALAEAKDTAKHAVGHATVLDESHRQLGMEYRRRTERFTEDFLKHTKDREEDKSKVKRLDIVVEQLNQEVLRMNRINAQMGQMLDVYKKESERRIQELEEEIRSRVAGDEALREEAQRVMDDARWLITIGRNAAKTAV